MARSRAAEQGLAEEVAWSSGPMFVLSLSYSLLTDQWWKCQLLITNAKLAWLQRTFKASLPSGCYYRMVSCPFQATRQLVWVSVRTSTQMGHGSSARLFICPSAYQFVHPIIHLLVYHLPVHVFVYWSISYPIVHVHSSISPIIHLSLCPPVLSLFLYSISFYKRFAVDGRNSHHTYKKPP